MTQNVTPSAKTAFIFDNSYFRELSGFYAPWDADKVSHPTLLYFNDALARDLGIDASIAKTFDAALVFSGTVKPDGAKSLAQAYAGHQFGGFSPKLGDGRAVLLGEIIAPNNKRYDIQLKGSGRTPFSRNGDGKAALGPVLREYLMGEAMHALGVPTTRALAAVSTGESVQRETGLQGAILTRIAESHIRVGTFQYFASQGEDEKLRKLADYTIARHYPELVETENKYLSFLVQVGSAYAFLVAKWMSVGFIHGVMNTDNVAISGETIDYGPCAFMDQYDPATVFSSIDHQGRYAYGNQPLIARWNLARFAETLLSLIDLDTDIAIEKATAVIDGFAQTYEALYLTEMRRKLGLQNTHEDDGALVDELLATMLEHGIDYTTAFRKLADSFGDYTDTFTSLFATPERAGEWLDRYHVRLQSEQSDVSATAVRMNKANPIYIPRNYHVEHALAAAADGNHAPFKRLLDLLQSPFTKQGDALAFEGLPKQADPHYKTFCGT